MFAARYYADLEPGPARDYLIHDRDDLYANLDTGPSKAYLVTHRDDPALRTYVDLVLEQRPAEELYDCEADPGQIRNRAGEPALRNVQRLLARRLDGYLRETGDPRILGISPWDEYTRVSL